MRSLEYEMELEGELEGECEFEGECEYEGEGEFEDEQFLGRIGDFARRQIGALRTPGSWQRNLALRAARAATSALPRIGAWAAGAANRAWGLPVDPAMGQRIGQWAQQRIAPHIPQREFEFEDELEYEDEAILNPARRAFQAATMAHLGHAAARAQSEAEAEAFLGALVPMAARLIPRIAPAVMRTAPALIRGVANVGRTLLRSPVARPLVRAVPNIVRGTVADMARMVSQGQPITGQAAVRSLARQTYRTLRTPQRARAAVRQTRAMDRQYHRRAGGCTCQ